MVHGLCHQAMYVELLKILNIIMVIILNVNHETYFLCVVHNYISFYVLHNLLVLCRVQSLSNHLHDLHWAPCYQYDNTHTLQELYIDGADVDLILE